MESADLYSRVPLRTDPSRALAIGWAYFRYWGWQFITKTGLGTVYLAMISEGARRISPAFSQKIYKLVPMLDHLNHRIDGATCFALFILVGCWCCWTWILQYWLGIKHYTHELYVIFPLAFVFITVDIVFFYVSTAAWRWGGSLFSFPAALATAGYVAVLVFVTYVGIGLKEEIRKAKS